VCSTTTKDIFLISYLSNSGQDFLTPQIYNLKVMGHFIITNHITHFNMIHAYITSSTKESIFLVGVTFLSTAQQANDRYLHHTQYRVLSVYSVDNISVSSTVMSSSAVRQHGVLSRN
jgi:hypothetical protein